MPRREETDFFLKTAAPRPLLSSTLLARLCSLKTPETPQRTCAGLPVEYQERSGTCKPAHNVNWNNLCILHTYTYFVQKKKAAHWAYLYLQHAPSRRNEALVCRLGLRCSAATLVHRVNASCAESTTSQSRFSQCLPSVDHIVFTGHSALAWFLQNPSGLYVGLCHVSKGYKNTVCFAA